MIVALLPLILGQSTLAAVPIHETARNADGHAVRIPAEGATATVLIFVNVDCPIANRMAPEISRIFAAYGPKGIQGYVVYADPTAKPREVRTHAKSFGFEGAALLDPQHRLARAAGASVTPQAAVFDANGRERYLGRINDLYLEHGKIQPKATQNELRDALDDLLAHRTVRRPITPAIGCFIGAN